MWWELLPYKFSIWIVIPDELVKDWKNSLNISGKYSLNTDRPLSFNLSNIVDGDLLNLKLNADYKKLFKLDIINYEKPKGSLANISINLDKKKPQ